MSQRDNASDQRAQALPQPSPAVPANADPPDLTSDPRPALPRTPLAPDDFYMEGGFLVFTGVYHLRRGFCCNSDCRHCPYK